MKVTIDICVREEDYPQRNLVSFRVEQGVEVDSSTVEGLTAIRKIVEEVSYETTAKALDGIEKARVTAMEKAIAVAAEEAAKRNEEEPSWA